jgi:hypothetical protein
MRDTERALVLCALAALCGRGYKWGLKRGVTQRCYSQCDHQDFSPARTDVLEMAFTSRGHHRRADLFTQCLARGPPLERLCTRIKKRPTSRLALVRFFRCFRACVAKLEHGFSIPKQLPIKAGRLRYVLRLLPTGGQVKDIYDGSDYP